MIFFLSLVMPQALAQICIVKHSQQAQTNSTIGTNIYPTSGSPFMMPLWNYFEGSGLIFSTDHTNLFLPLQAVGASINSNNVPNWGIILTHSGQPIASTSYNFLNNSDLQSGYYAVLSIAQNGYYVTFAKPVSGGFEFQQVPFQIQGSQCFDIVFINKIIAISCISSGHIVFYTIDTQSEVQIPIPISVNYVVGLSPDGSTLQVIQNGEYTYLVLSLSYPTPQTTQVYQFLINLQESKSKPIQLTEVSYLSLLYCIAFKANSDGTIFNLLQIQLQLQLGENVIATYFANKVTKFIDFGVYEVQTGTSIDYIIGLITNNGLQNLYYNSTTQKFMIGGLIDYPQQLELQTYNVNYSVIVNTEYVTFSTGIQIVVFPSYLNQYPYFIWTSVSETNNFFITTFDVRSNIIITFGQNTYTMGQVNSPILTLNQNNINLQTGTGVVLITATSTNNTKCNLLFNYQFVNAESPAQATINGAIPTQQYFYPQPGNQVLSPYFYGNNLTYQVQSDIEVNNITVKQVLLYPEDSHPDIEILFNQLFQNPYNNTSYIEIKQTMDTASNTNQLYIGYAGVGIDQVQAFKGAYIPGRITAASVGPALNGLVNIALLNQDGQIYVYTVEWKTTISDISKPSAKILVPTGSQFPPTLIFTNIHYLTDLLYIITSNPQSLLVYQSSSSQYLYTFSTLAFNPIAVYSNFLSYGNYIFIDNQFELIVAQCFQNGYVIAQSITYSQDNTQQSIGIGLLQDGIYIALTNDNIQTIQFYPRQIIHSTYIVAPISQIIQIPINIEIQYPVTASFTNMKFYLAWTNAGSLELAIFQAAYGINNILYYSQYLEEQDALSSISSVSVFSDTPFDIVITNGYTHTLLGVTKAYTIQMKVWNQTYADLVSPQLAQIIEYYDFTYIALSPTSTASASLIQEVVNGQIYIDNTTPPKGYQNQFLEQNGLIQIKPEQYFIGTIQNYTYVAKNQVKTQIINPITPTQMNIISTLVSVTCGDIYQDGTIQGFFASQTALFQYNPQWEIANYIEASSLPQLFCPNIFIYQNILITICAQGSEILAYQYNPFNKNFTKIYTFEQEDLVIANYANIQNQNTGLLAMETGIGNSSVQIYSVTSTTTGVTFSLLCQSESTIQAYYQFIEVITNTYDDDRQFNLFGVLLIGSYQKQVPQMILSYTQGPLDAVYPLNLRQVQVNIENIPFELRYTIVVPYYGINLPNSIVIACASRYTGGLFQFDISQLDNVVAVQANQIYTFQGFQGMYFCGIQTQGSMLVVEFIDASGKQDINVVGIYQEPAYFPLKSQLTLKGYWVTQQGFYNFHLTTNGTLLYQFGSQTLSQVFISSNIYIAIDIQSLDLNDNNGQPQNITVPILLTAQNQYNFANQELEINIQLINGSKYEKNSEAKWYFVGFGVAFGVVILGVIGYLCYKSQSNRYSDI